MLFTASFEENRTRCPRPAVDELIAVPAMVVLDLLQPMSGKDTHCHVNGVRTFQGVEFVDLRTERACPVCFGIDGAWAGIADGF